MSTVDTALAQLKAILATVDPSPQPTPKDVFIYPDDYASIDRSVTAVPFITVEQVVNENFIWGSKVNGKGVHRWEADCRVFIRKGQLTKDADILDGATKVKPWLKAIADTLFANMSLNGEAAVIGGGRIDGNEFRGLFDYRIGHMSIGANADTLYFGLAFRVPIMQTYTQEMSA